MKAGTRFGVLNMCSAGNKSAQICSLIGTSRYDIFVEVETWHEARDSPALIAATPPGYLYVERARPVSSTEDNPRFHGGVCIIYRQELTATVKTIINSTTFEYLATMFMSSHKEHFLVIAIYRPGSSQLDELFHHEFNDLLDAVCLFSCPVFILGDMNIHLDNLDNQHTVKFSHAMESHGFSQRVSGPTHVKGHTLDVVVVSAVTELADLLVNPPVYSDHSVIEFTSTVGSIPVLRKTIFRRPWIKIDKVSFSAELAGADLATATGGVENGDVQSLFAHYDDVLSQLADKYAPLKRITIRTDKSCPWFDAECCSSKRLVRRLEAVYRRSHSDADRKSWKDQFGQQRLLFQKKRSEFFRRRIEATRSDIKGQWKVLSSLLSSPADSESCPISADTFQSFFTNKVADVRSATEGAVPPCLTPLVQPGLSIFRMLTVDDTTRLIRASASKTCDLDSVPTWLVKDLENVFAPILTRLINASLSSGHLPVEHKRAVVRPVLKKPNMDPSTPSSYRPVSNVTFLSKLIERAVNQQLKSYLDTNNLIPAYQSGFRRFHSTETAVVKVYNDIVIASDTGRLTALVMLDYAAAFDTVDHGILLDILRVTFGLSGVVLDWICSFLSGRTQVVRIGGTSSSSVALFFGVPQGSVLGPLLYILYAADIIAIFEKHGFSVHLYADDSQVYIHFVPKDVKAILGAAELCIGEVLIWSNSRRLKLQAAKTELIIIDRTNCLLGTGADFVIQFDGSAVKAVSTVRDLGVLLDSRLNLKSHVANVSRACFYHLRRLRQIRECLDDDSTRTVVVALILSRLDYCNAILAGLPDSTLAPLTRVLHAAARVVLRLGYRDPITPALRHLHWLPIQERVKFKLCLLMFNIVQGCSPSYLQDMVTSCAIKQRGRQQLRSASDNSFAVRRTKLRFGERAFSVAGPAAWNSLPVELRFAQTSHAFKKGLKTLLFKSIL